MAMQQSNPQPDPQKPDIELDYTLHVTGSSAKPIYALEGDDKKDKDRLHKNSKNQDVIDCPYGIEWYVVKFKLKDGGLGLRFNESRPVDAQDGDTCPEQFSGVHTNQFANIAAAASQIVIVNKNQDQRNIGYSLNLVDKDGNDVPPFDPIFQNSGGGRAGFM